MMKNHIKFILFGMYSFKTKNILSYKMIHRIVNPCIKIYSNHYKEFLNFSNSNFRVLSIQPRDRCQILVIQIINMSKEEVAFKERQYIYGSKDGQNGH